ncbi:MAG: alpha/beta fold hydrolase [Gammaproteobacteria bacterium]|nr:alpha/beta fold hydrolase [Gammaproteobacteria bacterium]
MKQFDVKTESGYEVPLTLYESILGRGWASVLILPALGISGEFYEAVAQDLAERGMDAVIMEQRGYGRSAIRPSRASNYGFREYLEDDIPAVLDWINENLKGEPVLMGHSLGGHLATLYASLNPLQVNKLILVATGSPWHALYEKKMAGRIRALTRIIPVVTAIGGRYNGKRIGFGGMEGSQLMRDWRKLAKHNTYRAKGMEVVFDPLIKAWRGNVLSVRYAQDQMAPQRPVEALNDMFWSAQVRRELLTEANIGKPADHFNWAREPLATVNAITTWLHPEIE